MSAARALRATFVVLAIAAPLVACTLVQSLDYLQADLGKDADLPDTSIAPDTGGGDTGTDGGALVVAADQTAPDLLAQDATTLYWISGIDLMSVAKTGGVPKKLASIPDTTFLAVDPNPDGNVYAAKKRDVIAVPKAGGAPVTVFKGSGATPDLVADTVAVDDTSLFVLEVDTTQSTGTVRRMAKDGGAAEVLLGDASPSALVVDPKAAVWFEDTAVSFYELAKGGAPPTAVAYPLGAGNTAIAVTGQTIALDGDTIYFVDSDNDGNPLLRTRKRAAAGTAVTIYRGGANDGFVAIAVGGTHLYAIDDTAGEILRIPKAGGPRERVVSGIDKPTSLVLDDAFVYFTESGVGSKGTVRKAALPK